MASVQSLTIVHLFSGLHFTLDPSTCPKRELVFSHDLSVAKLTSPSIASVMSRVTLSNGCHYWKVRIDQFVGASNNGFVAIGVAKEVEDGRPIGMIRRTKIIQKYRMKYLHAKESSHKRVWHQPSSLTKCLFCVLFCTYLFAFS